MLSGIIGIEVRISRLDGKWKVTRDRSRADQLVVVEGLRRRPTEGTQAMAALVLQHLQDRSLARRTRPGASRPRGEAQLVRYVEHGRAHRGS